MRFNCLKATATSRRQFRDFLIENACNNNFELWRQELSSAKDTINEDQIKSYERLPIAYHAITTDCIQSAKFTKHYT